jgi:hypothetical protein
VHELGIDEHVSFLGPVTERGSRGVRARRCVRARL